MKKKKKTMLKEALTKIKENYNYKEDEIKIAVIIGPEGGLSEKEVEMIQENNNVITVSLGKKDIKNRNSSIKCTKYNNV